MSISGVVENEPHVPEVVREDTAENSAEVDATVAAIMHLQQLQQKQEVMQLIEAHPVTNADTEFREQLEELVRDHLNTCMALASHSTPHGSSSRSPSFGMRGDDNDSHQHLLDHSAEHYHHHHHHHHQYHLVVENEGVGTNEDDGMERHSGETADSPASVGMLRPQSGILGRWDERQGSSEPTVMERQVCEAELLALSSLHAVSTLDASFLQGSPSPRTENSIERPQRPSPLVQMWRELEEEQGYRDASQTSDRPRVGGCEPRLGDSWSEIEGENEAEIQGINEPDGRNTAASDSADTHMESSHEGSEHLSEGSGNELLATIDPNERESLVEGEPSALEELSGNTINAGRNHTQEMNGSHSEMQELDGVRERVQQMARRWMQETEVATERTGNVRASNLVDWPAEGERERVRQMAREWVRVSNSEVMPGHTSERQAAPSPSQEEGPSGVLENSPSARVQPERNHIGWSEERERQMVLDLLMRSEQERQRELEGISEHHTVSEFAHRTRLQSFLRGRFLRSGDGANVDRPPSVAAGEIGQLRQRRAVSGIREGFRFRLETIVRNQNNAAVSEWQRSQEVPQTSPQTPAARFQRGMPRERPAFGLHSLEDATAYNMELRELLARQSVTTMLASEFRDRLDQLIRSFIQTQGRTPQPWNFARSLRQDEGTTAPNEQQHSQEDHVLERDAVDRQRSAASRAGPAGAVRLEIPPPPPPPPHPLWQQEFPPPPPPPIVVQQQHRPVAWPRRGSQRSAEMEWEATGRALRADVTVLQRGMSELREMMEASIQMQYELQRSIRQEISGALQRMYVGKALPDEALDGSKWTFVKKGACCICCDKQVDCLLYRCGHMCTCVTCAIELHKNSGRCPMCRASIVEVVRAFTVA